MSTQTTQDRVTALEVRVADLEKAMIDIVAPSIESLARMLLELHAPVLSLVEKMTLLHDDHDQQPMN